MYLVWYYFQYQQPFLYFFFYKYDPNVDNTEEEKIDEIKGPLLEGNNKEEKEETEESQDKKGRKEIEEKKDIEETKEKDEKKENKMDNRVNASSSFSKPSSKKNIKRALKNWNNL